MSSKDTNACYYAVLIFGVRICDADAYSCSFETDMVEMMLLSPSEPDGGMIPSPKPSEPQSEPHRTRTQQEIDSQVFFMDVSSHFKSANITTRGYTDSNCVAMSIKLSQNEHDRMQRYLLEMLRVEIAYGFSLLPLMLVPSFVSAFWSDLSGTTPGDFKSLTSCQACLHTLRNCLDMGRSITANLGSLNSRCVSTNRLFSMIEPFSRRIEIKTLKCAEVCFRKL